MDLLSICFRPSPGPLLSLAVGPGVSAVQSATRCSPSQRGGRVPSSSRVGECWYYGRAVFAGGGAFLGPALIVLTVMYGPPVLGVVGGVVSGLRCRPDERRLPFSLFPALTGLVTGLLVGAVCFVLSMGFLFIVYSGEAFADHSGWGELAFLAIVAAGSTVGSWPAVLRTSAGAVCPRLCGACRQKFQLRRAIHGPSPRAGDCTGVAPGTATRLVPELTGLAHDGVADSLHFHRFIPHPRGNQGSVGSSMPMTGSIPAPLGDRRRLRWPGSSVPLVKGVAGLPVSAVPPGGRRRGRLPPG